MITLPFLLLLPFSSLICFPIFLSSSRGSISTSLSLYFKSLSSPLCVFTSIFSQHYTEINLYIICYSQKQAYYDLTLLFLTAKRRKNGGENGLKLPAKQEKENERRMPLSLSICLLYLGHLSPHWSTCHISIGHCKNISLFPKLAREASSGHWKQKYPTTVGDITLGRCSSLPAALLSFKQCNARVKKQPRALH